MQFEGKEFKYSNIGNNKLIYCPNCDENPLIVSSVGSSRCRVCGECIAKVIFCRSCGFRVSVCSKCDGNILKESDLVRRSTRTASDVFSNKFLYGCAVLLVAVIGFVVVRFQILATRETLNLLENFKESYPSQKEETWFHILSVLEMEVPTVKSLILLHREDKKTLDCLTRMLVSIYSHGKVSEKDGIIFGSAIQNEDTDYGEVLQFYLPVVREHRVFVTNLNKVSSNTARIFHSLCDEVSSDIKPSLFIFTLQYDQKTENLKPLERATTVLKEAWRELPDSDMFPLLSRVVKNVVDVVPEKEMIC